MSYLNSIFDKIYLINLQHRKDRLNTMTRILNKHNIEFERFEAINGKYTIIYNYWYNKLQKIKNYKIKSPGAFGYLLSMYYILINALNKDYKTILILDDDLIFHKEFNSLLNKIQFPEKWKLIYFGACHQNHIFQDTKKNIMNVKEFQDIFGKGNIDGSHMIGIHKNIIKELIILCKYSLYPFDSGVLKHIYSIYPKDCYIIYPYICIQDIQDSDIQNSNQQKKDYLRWGWKYELYDT